ncbi:MAG: amidohydrolase family protein [Deltaproteobacteria bacterium]|nr:amidohydrolase family protein [Deltaproteobacteria bacterium]
MSNLKDNQEKLLLTDFVPRSMLELEEHKIEMPKFPVIDAHNHLGKRGDRWAVPDVDKLVADMDSCGLKVIVNVDGCWGDLLKENLDRYKGKYPERFAVFAGVNWWDVDSKFGVRAAEQLEKCVRMGAQGLKISKALGLRVKDTSGNLLRADDERLQPLWEKASELNIPVLYHIADPVAFFKPLDRFNERWEELHNHPGWHFYGPEFPSFMELMEQQRNLVTNNPNTKFISAHVAGYAENLRWVGELMNNCPNLYVDISERIAELGRQPYTAREFFIAHQNRILFGVDVYQDPGWYRVYYRSLETKDEYFGYGLQEIPRQGRWQIYGLYLPDDVLEKVYHQNAEGLLRET